MFSLVDFHRIYYLSEMQIIPEALATLQFLNCRFNGKSAPEYHGIALTFNEDIWLYLAVHYIH